MPSIFEAYGLADSPEEDKPKAPEPRGALGVLKDYGISALKGAIEVPEAAVGLADLVTGGHAGRALEEAGFRPAEAKAILDEQYSPEQQEAFRRVQAAQGFGDTLMEAIRNPSVVAHSVVESLPAMGAGGVVARGGMALAPRLSPVFAGAIGEGTQQAGQAAETIRNENPDKLLTGKQAGAAVLSGVLDTAIAAVSGRVAKAMGFADPDTMLAAASRDVGTARKVSQRVLGGIVTEGFLEELPQSIQEQVLQNYAQGKPLDEGVNQAAVLGLLSGGVMGAGANVIAQPAKVPEVGALSRAANTGTDVAAAAGIEPMVASPAAAGAAAPAQAAAQEPAEDPIIGRINQLQGTDRSEALAAYNLLARDDTPKGVRQYNSKLLDDLLAKLEPVEEPSRVEPSDPAALLAGGMATDPLQQALAARRDEQTALMNLDTWMKRAVPLPLQRAQEIVALGAEQGHALEVVPHAAGQGFTVIPAEWVTPAMRNQVGAALPLDTAPTGVLRADARGNVAPETGAQAIDSRQAQAAADAERSRKDALGLTPDVERVQAGVKRAPLPTVQEGDITLKSGDPFKNKGAAVRAQAKAGAGEVLQVQGGWVVRTQPTKTEVTNVGTADAAATVAPGDGGQRGDDAGGSGGNPAAAGVDADGRVVHPAAAPADAGEPGAAVRDAAGEQPAAVAPPERWAAADAPAREKLLLAAGWKPGSPGVVKMQAQSWEKMTQGQRNRIQKAMDAAPVATLQQAAQNAPAEAPQEPVVAGEPSKGAEASASNSTAAAAPVAPEPGTEAAAGNGEGAKPEQARTAETPEQATEAKKFYVTMVRDGRTARLAGPFDSKEEAEAHVEPARKLASEIDPFSDFDAFGVSAITSAEHRPGTLNDRLAVGKQEPTTPAPKEQPNAAEQIAQQGSVQGEREDGDRSRQAAEAGGGDRVQRAAPGAEAATAPAGGGKGVRAVGETPAPVAASRSPHAPAAKIEDFGEKLEGARKDYAALLKDAMAVDVSAEPLSKSWPEPDYQKLLEGGADQWVLAFIHAERDEIPTKPQKSWKLKTWVHQVTLLRDVANKLLTGEISKDKVRAKLAESEWARLFNTVAARAELYERLGHEHSLKGIEVSSGVYSIYRGQHYSPAKIIWTVEQKARATAFSNMPRELASGDTREAAITAFVEKMKAQPTTAEKKTASFDLWRESGKVHLGKKIGRNYVTLKIFDGLYPKAVAEARAYMKDHADELTQALEKYKSTPMERRAENQPRVGDDHRGGARVTPEIFGETFGFRGVQFGNYVEQSKRQDDLNRAYDSLMDLAGLLGVPPKALSLDGQLGLAFGARGRGGKGAPAAHFESGKVVINLTKESGAGSLAHEWFHAADNYFAKMGGGKGGFVTAGADNAKLRPEMAEAFKKVMTAIRTTGMQKRSVELDERKSKPYWSVKQELAARAFEAYVVAKLQDQSASNDYLANIVSEDFWKAQEALFGHENEETYPYPTEAEMAGLREAFDNFFRTVETKASDKGVAMFRRTDVAEAARQALAPQQLQEFVDGITAEWANAPKVVVLQDMQDPKAPEPAREADAAQRSQGADDVVHGFHYEGKVYLVADGISSPREALETLAHEALGHYGLQGFYGDRLKPILQQIVAMRGKEVRAKAGDYGMQLDQKAVRAELGAGATDADVRRVIGLRLTYAAEEVLAEMAQTTPTLGFVRRAIAAIRTFLRDTLGLKLELTDDEIVRSFILPARGWVVRGEGTGARREADQVNFSRGNTLATDRPVAAQIMQAMNDTFNAPGKLNWWHKTVGTQYNLAQRSPLYKRVFDSVQHFINDVSLYATEAADLAPKILPKLETWRDIAKKPISAVDNKAASAPIFEGTLSWTRDEKGRPVKVDDIEKAAGAMSADDKARELLRRGLLSENVIKMWQGRPLDEYQQAVATAYKNRVLRAGIVWKDEELRSKFGLNDEQIGLYKQFRAAVDRSITQLAISDMVRFAGKDLSPEVRAEALASSDVDAAALMIRDDLLKRSEEQADRKDVLIDSADRVIEKADRARDLMERGYAPLSRFGHYTLDVIDEGGERVFFGMFETAREAAIAARKMRDNFPKAQITRGTVSQEEYKLFAGVSPETVELFGELLGLEAQGDDAASKAFQTYVKVARSNRSAMKRLIERKGIAGFSEDVGRVLAGFVYSNARQTSQNLHMGEMTDAAAAITDPEKGGSKSNGELKDHAVRLVEYIKNPQEEAQAFRGLLFAQYLGGSVASAMVNMLQPVQITFPYLSQFGGAVKAASRMKTAVADVMKKTTGDAALDAALKKAEEEGIVAPQEVFQLMNQAQGRAVLKSGDGTPLGNARARASNAFNRLALAWGKVFSTAEQFNRRVTFIAAYRTAVEQGIVDPAAFAAKAVNETQFIYNKGSKPNWARGPIGGTIFTFKQYSINYVELLHRMATQGGPEGKRAALLALGMLFLFSGAGGLPFAEDVQDVVDAVMQRLGYNFSSKLAKQQFFEKILGKDLGRFAEHGLSGLPGSPIDVSGRLGMGNLIPGTGLLVDKEDHTRDVTEFLGAGGEFATRLFKGANQVAQGELFEAGKQVAPRAAANAAKAIEMATTGVYKDDRGRKVIDVDGYDAIAKALGFQPSGVARVQEATGEQQQLIAQAKGAEARFADRWAKAVADGDQDALRKVREDIAAYNRANPDTPVVINRAQINKRILAMREDKATRIAKTAPREIRASVRQALGPAP